MKKNIRKLTIWNKADLRRLESGVLHPSQVRKIRISLDLDEKEPYLFLPKSLIEDLGLKIVYVGDVIQDGKACRRYFYSPVALSKTGRTAFVLAVPDGFPPSLGLSLFATAEIRSEKQNLLFQRRKKAA